MKITQVDVDSVVPYKSKLQVEPQVVFSMLESQQGPVQWEPRYDGISELVFTILSQHTSDLNALRAFDRLRKTFSNWEYVIAANDLDLVTAIKTGGLSNVKAPRIKAVLNTIHHEIGGFDLSFLREMPLEQAKSWLKHLPGVGPKTAAIVLCFAFGMPAMPVDTHVYRVAKRLGLIDETITVEKAHDLLEQLIEPRDVYSLHVLLITHGRTMCKALRPTCNVCPLRGPCPAKSILERGHLGKNVERRTDTRSPY